MYFRAWSSLKSRLDDVDVAVEDLERTVRHVSPQCAGTVPLRRGVVKPPPTFA
jgi:hypothetical protein